jgi:trehalose/maltose hydrolase-like predicted phosphorylase
LHVFYATNVGFDVTPWYSGEYEDHVTGDVAQAFQQYIMLTHDTRILLHENMSDAIFAMADFWISRSSYDVMHDTYNIFGKHLLRHLFD